MSYFQPYIDADGLHIPTYEDRLESLVNDYNSIFSVSLTEDDPDYQFLAIFAKKLDDASGLIAQVFASWNPAVASDVSLDLLLPLYGLVREEDEDDDAARKKISNSLSGRGSGSVDAILASVKRVENVRNVKIYVNSTDSTDSRGISAHGMAIIVYGGNNDAIARAIYETKPPGISTGGTTSISIRDDDGQSHIISFSKAASRRVFVYMTVQRLIGIDEDAVRDAITASINAYINGLAIGEGLIIPRLYSVAYAAAPQLATTFAVMDCYANAQGEATYTRDEVTCPWDAKITILSSGGLTITFID